MTTTTDTSADQAQAQLDSIRSLLDAWDAAHAVDDDDAIEEAGQAIQEDALSVEVRSGWYAPGSEGTGEESGNPEEYTILLCTGGPAVRIIGDLSQYSEPESATLEHQDWGTSWAPLDITHREEQALIEYATHYYFGA